MERFRCQSRCPGQRVTQDPLVHRAFLAEMAEMANKVQQERLGHKVLLVHKARRERKAPRAFPAKTVCLALQDETAETANKVLLVHKARRGPKVTRVTQEAACRPLTSCLCT